MTSALRTYADGTTDKAWSAADLASVRQQLVKDVERVRSELSVADVGIWLALSEEALSEEAPSEEAPSEEVQAEAMPRTAPSDQQVALLEASIEIDRTGAFIDQAEHALDRLDRGLYGVCETCGNAVGRDRLTALPRTPHCILCAARPVPNVNPM